VYNKLKTQWIAVNIDKKIVDRVKEVIKHYGYKSVADYAADAIRRRLEHHEMELDIQTRKLERLAEMEE